MSHVVVCGDSAEQLCAFLTDLGADVRFTTDPIEVMGADGLIVYGTRPGTDLLQSLRAQRIDRFIERRLAGGRPVLAVGTATDLMFDELIVADGSVTEGLGQWRGRSESLPARRSFDASVDVPEQSALFAKVGDEQVAFSLTSWVREDPAPKMAEHPDLFDPPLVAFAQQSERFVAGIDNGALAGIIFDPASAGGCRVIEAWLARLAA